MEQYNSFIHYLQIHYKEKIEEYLESFLNKKGKDFLELNKDVYGFKCLNTDIVHYEFTKSELNNVEFDVYFTVEINAIIAQSPEVQYKALDSKYFKTHMKGNFEAGFGFSKCKPEKVNRKPFKENLTYNLVHVIKKDKMDQYASKFLEYFCPEALKTPMKLNIEEMYKAKGIKFYRAPLTSDVYGKTYFADDIAEVYDDEGIPKRIDITRGTILINSNKETQGIGAERNTLIHEGVHYFFHGNYFDLMFALDNSKTCSIYKKGDSDNPDIKWMEHQASKLAPLILMPLKTFKQKYNELKKQIKAKNKNKWPYGKKPTKADYLYWTAIELADFFGVSKASVKIRLIDIGVLEADGIFNYDDELKTPYKVYGFNKKYLTDHQTFNLNKVSFKKLIESNEEIRKLIEDKKLLYLNGLVVVNNNKYVQCGQLTDYALRNVHECALLFDVTSDSRPLSDNVSKFSLCRSAESTVLAQPNIEQLQRIIQLADENSTHYELHRKELPGTFGKTIEHHIAKLGWSYNEVCDRCDVTNKPLLLYRNDEYGQPDYKVVIKIAIGLKLSKPYIDDLMYKSGLNHANTPGRLHNILMSIQETAPRLGLAYTCRNLSPSLREELKISKRFINKYKII